LSDRTLRIVLNVLSSGFLTRDEQVNAGAAAIAAAQRRAVTLADVALAAELSSGVLPGARPVGVVWMESAAEQSARLGKSVATVISDNPAYVVADGTEAVAKESLAVRMGRLVDGQVVEAASWSRGEAGATHAKVPGGIVGWIRGTSSKPCEWCQKVRGSPPAVHPVEHRIALHMGNDHCRQQYVSTLAGYGKWVGAFSEKPTA